MSDSFELKTEDLEFYETPIWAVKRILEVMPVAPGHRWIDPCAGSCAIQDAVATGWLSSDSARRALSSNRSFNESRMPLWTLVDIDARHTQAMQAQNPGRFLVADFLKLDWHEKFDVALFNPPFSRAVEFVRELRRFCAWVIMLQRLDWLGGAKERVNYLRGDVPDTYILPDRPSFTGGQTDLREYAWFVWEGVPRSQGRTQYLNFTSLAEKKALRGQMTLGV